MGVAFANGGLSELDGLHKVCLNQRVFVSVRACMFLHAHTHTHTHTHTHAHAATPSHAHTPSLCLCPSPGPAAVLQAVHSDRVGDWRVRHRARRAGGHDGRDAHHPQHRHWQLHPRLCGRVLAVRHRVVEGCWGSGLRVEVEGSGFRVSAQTSSR